MQVMIYDGSFTGWLTAVFEVYEYKYAGASIVTEQLAQQNIFGGCHQVYTCEEKAARVWEGLRQRLSATATTRLFRAFLSEEKGMEDQLLRYAQYAFSRKQSVENDYSHPAVTYVMDTARKVYREKHRMEAFVRFQLTADGLYYAVIDPDFNVLPLIRDHFEKRYADQRWMIYDVHRRYGIYYDLQQTSTVSVDFREGEQADRAAHAVLDEKEALYQQLWQQYFNSVNIAARKNTKLHIQHMPLRYWKYLPEKKSSKW